MDVVPKMIGTDRRYTTLKLKYSRDVKLVMFYDTYVYTETPQDATTYISQRKRWGTNTFSNSLINISSRNIPWFTKLSGIGKFNTIQIKSNQQINDCIIM